MEWPKNHHLQNDYFAHFNNLAVTNGRRKTRSLFRAATEGESCNYYFGAPLWGEESLFSTRKTI